MSLKPRSLNLYARILLWLLVNVAVLGAVFFGVLQWQFREGLHGALGGIAGDRLQAIGRQVHAELNENPRSQWDALLHEMGLRHHAQVLLAAPPDRHIAGERLPLPKEVRQMLLDMHPEIQARLAGGGPPERRPPPPPRDMVEDLLFGDSLIGEMATARPEPPTEMPVKLGTFMMRAGDPQRYYTGIRLPPPTGWQLRDGPVILLIITRSMTGGGLFFDIRPWLGGIFGAMAVSALLWLPFVSSITRSIRANMQATEQIAKGRFDVRVPEDRSDELGRLAHAVNQMAVQLDGIVRGQKRFLGDIAHELCSPIARMEMSLGILDQRLSEKDAARLGDVRDELRQISLLVNELLSFSRASLGHAMKPAENVLLLALVDEIAAIEGVPPQHLRLRVPRDLQVKAVPDLLRRAIGNVLRNARIHAPNSDIEITAARAGDHVRLTLADTGPGVPEDSLPRLFDPFYRVDTSRARETGGTGLGLAIVKTCIETCGGSVSARNRDPHGLIIAIELPCA